MSKVLDVAFTRASITNLYSHFLVVISDLCISVSEIFSTTDNLFSMVLELVNSKTDSMSIGTVEVEKRKQLSSFRSALNSFLSCAKKVTTSTFLGTIDGFDSLETADIFRLCPMMEGWMMVLPSLFAAIKILHSLWHPNIRARISQNFDSSFKLIFLPNLVDVAHSVGVKNGWNHQLSHPIGKCCNEFKEIRIWLYMNLAQACVHKSMYLNSFTAETSAFLSQLVEDCKVNICTLHLLLVSSF